MQNEIVLIFKVFQNTAFGPSVPQVREQNWNATAHVQELGFLSSSRGKAAQRVPSRAVAGSCRQEGCGLPGLWESPVFILTTPLLRLDGLKTQRRFQGEYCIVVQRFLVNKMRFKSQKLHEVIFLVNTGEIFKSCPGRLASLTLPVSSLQSH